jgi:RNA polymerase sigma-70 factor (ECF subfamily)
MAEAPDEFAALVARVRQGDEAALEQLVRQYEKRIRLTARALLRPVLRPYLDSDDLVQSVHRVLLPELRQEKFDSLEKLLAFAVVVVKRKVARHWRHLKRQKRLEGEPGNGSDFLLASLNSKEADPASAAQLKDLKDQLHKVLSDLNEKDRRLLELRLEGYTMPQVADELGIDAKILRVRLSRLRQRLRDQGLLTKWI